MNQRIKFIAIAVMVLFYTPVWASHLSGADFTYKLIDSIGGLYHYRVNLSIYQDCDHGDAEAIAEDNPAFLGLFSGTGVLISKDSAYYPADSNILMPVKGYGLCDSGTVPLGSLCLRRKVFTKDYRLKPSATGYIIAYERCCRNEINNIIDPINMGMACYITLPPMGGAGQNSSAVFTNYPPMVIGKNIPFAFDFSATDADGDSLTYAFVPPSAGNSGSSNAKPYAKAPPYASVTFTSPLTYNNPVYSSVPFSINATTGLLTGTPGSTGLFLVAVSCSEWRKGVLLNTTRREFEFTVASCTLPGINKTESLFLYPNPATSELNIVSDNEISDVSISNVLGQNATPPMNYTPMLGDKTNTHMVTANISNLAPGVYFVRVNNKAVKRFVRE